MKLFLLGTLCLLLGYSSAFKLWAIDEDSMLSHRRRLADENLSFRQEHMRFLDEPQLFTASITAFQQLTEGMQIFFNVPTSSRTEASQLVQKNCTTSEGSMTLPKASYENIENFTVITCLPNSFEELTVIITNEIFTGIFRDANNKHWYIDRAFSEDLETYIIYEGNELLKSLPTSELEALEEIFHQHPDFIELPAEEVEFESFLDINPDATTGETNGQAFVFRFLPVSSPGFAVDVSNGVSLTVTNVAAEITSIMTRVNAIYASEAAIFFQLIPGFEEAICLSFDQSTGCSILTEDQSNLAGNGNILTALGFPSSDYDLGQRLISPGGGVAYLRSLCGNLKAGGISGGFGTNYPRALITLMHEIGHMLSSSHSWKDCTDYQGQFSSTFSAEPGAGTTIMSYAGSCRDDNQVQVVSDSYFNTWSLVHIRSWTEGVVENVGCGEVLDISREMSELTTVDFASVPIGNYFQIVGESTSDENEGSFFSWERIDVGFEDFADDSVGRIRSYKPTTRRSRFFPNLNFLNFEQDFSGEKVIESVGRWRMRFVERSKFDLGYLEEPSEGLMGDFLFSDTTINFLDFPKLSFNEPSSGSSLALSSPISFSVSVEGLERIRSGATVQILFATNTMSEVSDLAAFDYADDVEDLDWIVVSEFTSSGGSCLSEVFLTKEDLGLSSEDLSSINGNFMVRAGASGDGDLNTAGVYIFDLITGITFYEDEDALLESFTSSVVCSTVAETSSYTWTLWLIPSGFVGFYLFLTYLKFTTERETGELNLGEIQYVKKIPDNKLVAQNPIFEA